MSSPVSDVVFRYSPADWERVRLGDLFESANIKLRDYDADSKDIPVLSMTRTQGLILQSEKFDKRVASKDTSPYKVVEQGQLVIGFPIDEACIAILHRYPIGIVSPAYQVLSPIREIDLTFIDFYLRTPALIQIYRTFSSTVVERRRSISVRDFSSIEVPLPPLDEQRRIAHVLSTVQAAIEQQARLIALTSELKSALLRKLFSEGLRGEKQKQTEIGLVPESWEVTQIGNVARLQSGGTPSREKAAYWTGGTIPWVKTTEINYRVIEATEEFITVEGLNNSAAKILPKGTLLVAMYGQGVTRGRVGILGLNAATNQACAAISVHDEKQVLTWFLYYYLQYHYQDLRELGHGANQRNLNMDLIKSFPLSYPEPHEQQRIVDSLSVLDSKLLLNEQKRGLLEELFRTLLHQLMTAQIRV